MTTPITYYGGKQRLTKELLPLIPKHKLYVEAFAGGAALFFAKQPSEAEILNDVNGEIENFYKVIKTQFEELKQKVEATLHSRNTYTEALNIYNNPQEYDPVTRAWAFWVVTNQGFSGKIGSWAVCNSNKTAKTIANKKQDFTKEYAGRLQYVQLENKDALKIIERADKEDTFFYLDPPYFNSDCGHYKGYTEEDFERLLKQLSKLKGKFLLSSYPSEILSKYIKKYKWNFKKIEQKVNVSHKTKKQKTEMIVFNYDTPELITNEIVEASPKPYKLRKVLIEDELEENNVSAYDKAVEIKKATIGKPIQLTDIAIDRSTKVYPITRSTNQPMTSPGMQQLIEKSKRSIEEYFTLIRKK